MLLVIVVGDGQAMTVLLHGEALAGGEAMHANLNL
jgi:hypothetical protein